MSNERDNVDKLGLSHGTTVAFLENLQELKHKEKELHTSTDNKKDISSTPSSWGKLLSLNPTYPDVELVETEIWLGRKKSVCNPQTTFIKNLKISNAHTRVSLSEDKNEFYSVVVEDHSANGTYVNGKLLGKGHKQKMHSGDILSLVYPNYDKKTSDKAAIAYKFVSNLEKWIPAFVYTQSSSVPSPTNSPNLSSSAKKSLAVKMQSNVSKLPEEFISSLKVLVLPHILEQLHFNLKSHDSNWVADFIDLGGLSQLMDIILLKHKKSRKTDIDASVGIEALRCVIAILNTQPGLNHALHNNSTLQGTALLLSSPNVNIVRKVLKLLASIACYSEKGHDMVMHAFQFLKKASREQHRFSILIRTLIDSHEARVLTNCMALINALTNFPNDVETRVRIRQEFLDLDILKLIESMKVLHDSQLDTQLNLFIDEMDDDKKEMMLSNINGTDVEELARILKKNPSYLSILRYFLVIPDTDYGQKMWILIEQQIKKIVTLQENVDVHNEPRVSIDDLRSLMSEKKRLEEVEARNRKDISAYEQKVAEEIEREKVALRTKYEEEKKDLEKKFKEAIVLLKAEKSLLIQHQRQLDSTYSAIPTTIPEEPGAPPPQPITLGYDKIPSNVPLGQENQDTKQEQSTDDSSTSSIPAPPESVETAPPPPGPPPPGPPPPGPSKSQNTKEPKYKPSCRMKQLYWKKLNVGSSTVWKNINFENVELDSKELENFFAFESKTKRGNKDDKKEDDSNVTLIDPSKARNIGIFMAVHKISAGDIKTALMNMDEKMLTIDKLKELLKLCPNQDEEHALQKYKGDIETLGDAEKFVMMLMSIPNVRARLETFIFKLSFGSLSSDIQLSLDLLLSSCDVILSSKILVYILEVILAIGNFCNYQPRKSPVSAFSIEFLTKLENTRSADNKTTLMHYLGQIIAQRNPDALSLPEDMSILDQSTKVALTEILSQIKIVKENLHNCKKELDLTNRDPEDRYHDLMEEFCNYTNSFVQGIDEKLKLLKQRGEEVASYFGEPSTSSLDDLLATIHNFSLAFGKAIKDNEREKDMEDRKKRIEQRRQTRLHSKEKQGILELAAKHREKILKNGYGSLVDGNMFKTMKGRRTLENPQILNG